MSGPVLYSTNPWFATEVAQRYRGGVHFAWVCECFDTAKAAAGTPASQIAPSSNPHRIYQRLREECDHEEGHSELIRGYKKTFKRLAKQWYSDGSLTENLRDEIIASATSPSWKIWRPVLYVIPREPIEAAKRLVSVSRKDRASYGPELQVHDLQRHEFDILELY